MQQGVLDSGGSTVCSYNDSAKASKTLDFLSGVSNRTKQ